MSEGILLIEDDPELGRQVVERLRSAGYVVAWWRSGRRVEDGELGGHQIARRDRELRGGPDLERAVEVRRQRPFEQRGIEQHDVARFRGTQPVGERRGAGGLAEMRTQPGEMPCLRLRQPEPVRGVVAAKTSKPAHRIGRGAQRRFVVDEHRQRPLVGPRQDARKHKGCAHRRDARPGIGRGEQLADLGPDAFA